jgi:hypothetical protein
LTSPSAFAFGVSSLITQKIADGTWLRFLIFKKA